jgi:hypothetical protein
MASGIRTDIIRFLGEDQTWTDVIYQADGATPQNITGWNDIVFVLHVNQNDGMPLFTKTVGGGIVLTDPTHGGLTIAINAADTAGLNPGVYWYYIAPTLAGRNAVCSWGQLILKPR